MRLTDDEVVALAVAQGRPWSSPTPTVDITNQDEARFAARRGERSLWARRLLREDVDDVRLLDDTESLLQPALEHDVIVSMFVRDDDRVWYPDAPNIIYYRCGGGSSWLAESVVEAGVHSFGTADPVDAAEELAEMVELAWSGGVRLAASGRAAATLCLATPAEADVEVLSVSRQSARLERGVQICEIELNEAVAWVRALG